MARTGAFSSFGVRRDVLWQVGGLARRIGASGQEQQALDETAFCWEDYPQFRNLSTAQSTTWDFQTTGVTAGPHPVALHRAYLERLGVQTIRALSQIKPGQRVLTAGAVISRQRPPTAKGMTFILLEDETGRLPTAIAPPVYEKFGADVREAGLLIQGRLEGAGVGQVGETYRSILIDRLWPLKAAIGGCCGYPGEAAR